LQSSHQPRDVGRVALQVAVHGDDDGGAGTAIAGIQGGGEAGMTREADVSNSPILAGELPEPIRAAIRAHVVDEDDLDMAPVCFEDTDQLRPEEGEILYLVEDGENHRELQHVGRGRGHGSIQRQEPRST
jgi:hypothetical protein